MILTDKPGAMGLDCDGGKRENLLEIAIPSYLKQRAFSICGASDLYPL